MLHRMPASDYCTVRELFLPVSHQLCSLAVLEGNSPGRVYVDDPALPQTAFMFAPEGCYLVGESGNALFNEALCKGIFAKDIFGTPVSALAFVVDPESWVDQLPTVFDPREPIVQARRHYVCEHVEHDWRGALPDSFDVHLIDEQLLDRTNLGIPEHVHGWITGNWGSVASFLERGFGAVTVHHNQVVSWSVCDCVTGDACEIGIHTLPEFRRRGLAAVTAAVAAEHALSAGYAQVGWQCAEDNLGSIGAAERVGFRLERHYTMYDFFLDECSHLLELGWASFKRREYIKTVQCDLRAFALDADVQPIHYHLVARAESALGRDEAALAHLRVAIDKGWSGHEHTEGCPEFDALRARPVWAELVGCIRENALRDEG